MFFKTFFFLELDKLEANFCGSTVVTDVQKILGKIRKTYNFNSDLVLLKKIFLPDKCLVSNKYCFNF